MRNEKILKLLTICTITLVIAVFINNLALHTVRRQYAPGMASEVSLFNFSGQFHEWLTYIEHWKSLADENKTLKTVVEKHIMAEAVLQSLQTDNDKLRQSLGLSTRLKQHVIPVGIFNVSLMAEGYSALVNKGKNENIAVSEAVATPDGILVGKIITVFPSSAQVMLITDPAFSVTAQILGGQTKGILRGALADGLTLDLITQSDQITEGDTLITTGDDLIPAGLIIGVVRNVENNDTQLFKKVKVKPAMNPSRAEVLIIQP